MQQISYHVIAMQQICYHRVAMQQISYYTGLSRATWELWHSSPCNNSY